VLEVSTCKLVRIFLAGAVNKVHTAPWRHCPNRNVFNDRRNSLYDKSASFSCDGRLFHRPGPAAENALSPKVLYVRVMDGNGPGRGGSTAIQTTAVGTNLCQSHMFGFQSSRFTLKSVR